MGGHGGLNILPQKKWNVYNYENREKVRRDEEEQERSAQAERDKQKRIEWEIKRSKMKERSKQRGQQASDSETASPIAEPKHINLFEESEAQESKSGFLNKDAVSASKKRENEAQFSFGYGSSSKEDTHKPWYASKPTTSLMRYDVQNDETFLAFKPKEKRKHSKEKGEKEGASKKGRLSLEELRKERLEREKSERRKSIRVVATRDLEAKRKNRA